MTAPTAPSAPQANEVVEILLIEDGAADAEFILGALRERGLGGHVKVAPDGQAALDYLFRLGPYRGIEQAQLPRLVILEHRIPRRSSLDVLQALKTDPTLKTIPVVVLSASEDEQDRDACLAAGANSFVLKPVSPRKFSDIIGQVAIYWMLINTVRGQRQCRQPGIREKETPLPIDGPPLRLLIVDRTEAEGEPICRELERAGFNIEAHVATSSQQFAARLDEADYDMVIAADALSGWTGHDVLRRLRGSGHDTPFLLVADLISDTDALQYLKEGAADYLSRDRLARLPVAVRRAMHDRAEARKRLASLEHLRAGERRQSAAAQLGKVILEGAGLSALRDLSVTLTASALGAPLGAYFEVSGDGRSATLLSGTGWQDGVVAGGCVRIELADGTPLAQAGEQQAAVTVGPSDIDHPVLAEHGVRHGLWAPVVGGPAQGTIGFLGFFTTDDSGFDEDQSGFVESIANLLNHAEGRRGAEERLRQSQKIEAVGQLAGGVAHDFNNLLTAITGYTSLLLDRVPPGTPLHPDLEEIDRAAKRGVELTHQLLAFSRRQVLQPEIVDINTVISDADQMLRRLLGERIDLVVITESVVGRTMADPGQLHHVLLNLAVNARDAMPDGGRLLIESNNTTVDEEYASRHGPLAPGEYVRLTVTDNGLGMDDEVKARLFEPFFTTKRRDPGTGLGLATVYGTVKQSGGYIHVSSAPGRGSTFVVYLPKFDEAPVAVPTPPRQTSILGTETLLVVEDEHVVRTLVTRVLRESGYTVLVAPDGEEGLRLAQDWDGPIDLVIADVVMPTLSGPEMVSRLAPLRRGLPVVFMSGYTESALQPRNVVSNDTAFLQKPFTPEALLGTIRGVLDRRRSDPTAEH